MSPETSNLAKGLVVPIPTLPPPLITMFTGVPNMPEKYKSVVDPPVNAVAV
jgi:hypothetical protein